MTTITRQTALSDCDGICDGLGRAGQTGMDGGKHGRKGIGMDGQAQTGANRDRQGRKKCAIVR